MIDHGIRGPVVLPGQATADGVVVPTHAGASPGTLAVVGLAVVGSSLLVASVFAALVEWAGWIAALLFAAVLPALALVGMIRALFRPDGLRVGSRDVALLRGQRVVWRRPLFEIARVELGSGGEWITLTTVDGEVRGASLGNLWEEAGAAEAVALHLMGAVERARMAPEALARPDPELLGLVGVVRGQG